MKLSKCTQFLRSRNNSKSGKLLLSCSRTNGNQNVAAGIQSPRNRAPASMCDSAYDWRWSLTTAFLPHWYERVSTPPTICHTICVNQYQLERARNSGEGVPWRWRSLMEGIPEHWMSLRGAPPFICNWQVAWLQSLCGYERLIDWSVIITWNTHDSIIFPIGITGLNSALKVTSN